MEKAEISMIENLKKNTGKTLEQWIQIVKKEKFEKHGQILKYLKEKHSMTHGYANLVSLKARKADAASLDEKDLLSNQYKEKEILLPIYEVLISKINQFGEDIIKTPKKDSVSIIRKKQFALIKPATKTRIDLGLKLKGKPCTQRLENSGPFGAMCTHRVKISSVKDVDKELIGWLKEAYQNAL